MIGSCIYKCHHADSAIEMFLQAVLIIIPFTSTSLSAAIKLRRHIIPGAEFVTLSLRHGSVAVEARIWRTDRLHGLSSAGSTGPSRH